MRNGIDIFKGIFNGLIIGIILWAILLYVCF